MKSNIVFLISLIAISGVMSSQFANMMQQDDIFKQEVQEIRESKMGKIVMDLVQLHSLNADAGNSTHEVKAIDYSPLFKALDNLSAFLGSALLSENDDYASDTIDYTTTKGELETTRDDAEKKRDAAISQLDSKLYPEEAKLKKTITETKKSLVTFNRNLQILETDRVEEIKTYKINLADYNEGISAIKQGLPLLNSLLNGGSSFLEINGEQLQSATQQLSASLRKIKYGQLFANFIETFALSLKTDSFTNQDALKKVIKLLTNLQKKLENGLATLEAQENQDKKDYDTTKTKLTKAIAEFNKVLSTAEANLLINQANIKTQETIKSTQDAVFKKAVSDLATLEADFISRTQLHKSTVKQITLESGTVQQCVKVLKKAGITRGE